MAKAMPLKRFSEMLMILVVELGLKMRNKQSSFLFGGLKAHSYTQQIQALMEMYPKSDSQDSTEGKY
jgi:hypothetical protein